MKDNHPLNLLADYAFGLESLRKLKQILLNFHPKKILLVTGRDSYTRCGASKTIQTCLEDIPFVHFFDFAINPKIEDAQKGTQLALLEDIDLILAVGGGSVIDMAKLIKAFMTDPESPEELVRGKKKIAHFGIPLIAIPTTAGSGSEATHFAVAYIGREKYSLASPYLLPNHVVLDGTLLHSSTPYQRACNGLDALAQAIESAWAIDSTEESRKYAFKAIEGLIQILPIMCSSSASKEVFDQMLLLSNLAGKAINISKTTSSHAWSYGFTSYYGVPHGHAVWLTLPEIFGIHAQATVSGEGITDPRGKSHVDSIINQTLSFFGLTVSEELPQILRKWVLDIGVEPMMEKMGVKTCEERLFLSRQINLQRMSNNPVLLEESQLKKIFRL